MRNQFMWDEKYNIGVEIIDKEHKRLFHIINKLFAFEEEEKKSQWACREGIKFFKEHAMKHFADEEEYMESIHYEDLETHKYIHKGFRENTLPALEQELELTNYSMETVNHFLGVCAGWLIGHTLTEDLAMVSNQKSKWGNRLSDEEHTSIKKTIIQLLFDVFHLESNVISETYGGEKFGNGVYYRLVYGEEDEKEEQSKSWEIMLVFEEKLLVNTVGKIIGLKSNKLDMMLVNATRYTAQQFVGRVMKHFPSMKSCKMKEENLLTYDQFKEVFDRKKPQFSLLFNTGEGYFSYCVIAPHLLENGIGTPLQTNNAISEIEKYLLEREEKEEEIISKKKLLLVDDSVIVRESMKELLSKDYEVSSVSSGLAAIRAITLNKPDLVLLDYEMPVCDGRQVLAMLRSEEAFADLPVFFLTSKTDQESVKKVISLKPDGYLSKYLKPADIKTKIDAYFERKEKKKEN